jgi:dipeptidyl aminopeptidase/acylaminoacyl peptidase
MLFNLKRAGVCLSALVLAYASGAMAQAPAALPSVASFFEKSAFSGAQLSPDAKSLAVKFSKNGGRTGLFVLDLVSDQAKPVASFDDMDVRNVVWVNNNRLAFDTGDNQIGQRDVAYAPGLFAVNRDGSGMRQLADLGRDRETTGSHIQHEKNRLPWYTTMLTVPGGYSAGAVQRGSQDSDSIYVQSTEYVQVSQYVAGVKQTEFASTIKYVDLLRLNTVNGRSTIVKRPPDVRSWLLDSAGEPRMAIGEKDHRSTIYLRDKNSDLWTPAYSGEVRDTKGSQFAPVGFAPDGTLYVNTNSGGSDTTALHTFDTRSGKVSAEPVIKTPGYDFSGNLISSSAGVLGMEFTTDARSTIWFDDKMKALQKRIDDLLPQTVNLLEVAARAETPWVLVTAYSDAQPQTIMLFNTQTGKLRTVGEAHPSVDPARMGRQLQVSYAARDGMPIPALLTLPAGKRKDAPLVVLIHDGPWERGNTWGWNSQSQFLASRGYAVLEPSFRGTTGLGAKHYKASFKQWGLSMQDDIADGAKWAVAKGYADPKRICVAGSGYGGYAALTGLIKESDLFKCGFGWAGITDLALHFKGHWSVKSDVQPSLRDYGGADMVGDLVKDAAQLRATSPLHNAAKLTQPLLLAYGGADTLVPPYQGEQFYKALKQSNRDVEFVVYPEEGHSFRLLKNEVDFWGRVEKFLDKHIGAPK